MAIAHEAKEHVVTTRLVNRRPDRLMLYLEPWGDAYEMPPDAAFEVVARGPQGDTLEVEFADDHIVLWGWGGSIVTVYYQGAPLGLAEEARPRV
jgi:hypothetical protein